MIEGTAPTSSSTADATGAPDSIAMTIAPSAKRRSMRHGEGPGWKGSGNTRCGVRRRGGRNLSRIWARIGPDESGRGGRDATMADREWVRRGAGGAGERGG